MGKTLKELLQDKKDGKLIPLAEVGITPPPTPPGPDPIIKGKFKDLLLRYQGERVLTRFETDAQFLKEFPKSILSIYGLDTKRILLQRDPHKDKVLIKKAAGAVGSVFGPLGRAVGGAIADFKPKYPDDWLDGEETDYKFDRYADLLAGRINNNKSGLGKIIGGLKTPNQFKENIGTALVSAGLNALTGLLKKKIKKNGPDITPPREHPIYPSLMVSNTTVSLTNEDYILDENQYAPTYQDQARRRGSFVIKPIDKDLQYQKDASVRFNRIRVTGWAIEDRKSTNLNTLYQKFENFVPELYVGFISGSSTVGKLSEQSSEQGEQYTKYKKVGLYSKDYLRYVDDGTTNWNVAPTLKQFEEKLSITDYVPIKPNLNYGDQLQNEAGDQYGQGTINDIASTNQKIFSYKTSLGKIQPIRYNLQTSELGTTVLNNVNDDLIYSKNLENYTNHRNIELNELKKDTIYPQTQKYVDKLENPYVYTFEDILRNNGEDRVKVKIGGISFPATIKNFVDKSDSNWENVKPIGSALSYYLYNDWSREITFDMQLYAENKEFLIAIWHKIERLQKLTTGNPSGTNGAYGVYGQIVLLEIGNLVKEFGFVEDVTVEVEDSSPWDIDKGYQAPMICNISLNFRVVTNQEGNNYKYYKGGISGSINPSTQNKSESYGK